MPFKYSGIVFALALAAVSSIAKPTPPVNYGVLVFPGFELLDVAGPIDFLNDLSFTEKINLAIISNTLDPVTTFVDLPEVNKAGSNFVQTVNPTHTFADPPSNLDVLLVPGGFGTRAPDPFFDDTIQYIKDVYPSLQYLLSVCTGATLVGRAGLLDNRRATTNKKAWKFATSFGKNVTWEPVARWVVDDNIWSTSGIAAGIDGLLGLVEHIYDADTSIALANDLEYEWHNDPAWDPFGAIWNVPGANGTQAERYEQCGGKEFDGPKACKSPYVCRKQNQYYYQCV